MPFFTWRESEESLEKFLEDLNKLHPNLKFTYRKFKEKINFLDVAIKINEGRIINDLYYKPANDHKYLHYDSCHGDHFSQTIPLKTLALKKTTLIRTLKILINGFVNGNILAILLRNRLKDPLGLLQIMKIISKR